MSQIKPLLLKKKGMEHVTFGDYVGRRFPEVSAVMHKKSFEGELTPVVQRGVLVIDETVRHPLLSEAAQSGYRKNMAIVKDIRPSLSLEVPIIDTDYTVKEQHNPPPFVAQRTSVADPKFSVIKDKSQFVDLVERMKPSALKLRWQKYEERGLWQLSHWSDFYEPNYLKGKLDGPKMVAQDSNNGEVRRGMMKEFIKDANRSKCICIWGEGGSYIKTLAVGKIDHIIVVSTLDKAITLKKRNYYISLLGKNSGVYVTVIDYKGTIKDLMARKDRVYAQLFEEYQWEYSDTLIVSNYYPSLADYRGCLGISFCFLSHVVEKSSLCVEGEIPSEYGTYKQIRPAYLLTLQRLLKGFDETVDSSRFVYDKEKMKLLSYSTHAPWADDVINSYSLVGDYISIPLSDYGESSGRRYAGPMSVLYYGVCQIVNVPRSVADGVDVSVLYPFDDSSKIVYAPCEEVIEYPATTDKILLDGKSFPVVFGGEYYMSGGLLLDYYKPGTTFFSRYLSMFSSGVAIVPLSRYPLWEFSRVIDLSSASPQIGMHVTYEQVCSVVDMESGIFKTDYRRIEIAGVGLYGNYLIYSPGKVLEIYPELMSHSWLAMREDDVICSFVNRMQDAVVPLGGNPYISVDRVYDVFNTIEYFDEDALSQYCEGDEYVSVYATLGDFMFHPI